MVSFLGNEKRNGKKPKLRGKNGIGLVLKVRRTPFFSFLVQMNPAKNG
jgi:hypothetical protein